MQCIISLIIGYFIFLGGNCSSLHYAKTAVDKMGRLFIQIRSLGYFLLAKHGFSVAVSWALVRLKLVNAPPTPTPKNKKKKNLDSCNWLVMEYLQRHLKAFDQTDRTLLSSVIYLPDTKNNWFWSCDSYAGPCDCSIIAASWGKKKRQTAIWDFSLILSICIHVFLHH